MKHLWRVCGLCWLCVLAGCAEPEPEPWTLPAPAHEATIEVLSEPPGANIEVNQDYIGKTPCTVTVRAYNEACDTFNGSCTICALPVITGQQVQRKHFYQWDSIPKRIFFDMRLVTVPDKLDINVRQDRPETPDTAEAGRESDSQQADSEPRKGMFTHLLPQTQGDAESQNEPQE